MPYCTIDPRAAGETLAQGIRDQLEAGRYVILDGADYSIRLTGAQRRGSTTIARTIDGAHVIVALTDSIRIERA